jgi:hypothetical protein
MKKILLIDTSDVGAEYSAEAIKRLGFQPVFLVNLADFHAETKQQIQQYEHYDVQTNSVDTLKKTITACDITGIAGVVTLLDSKIPVAIALADWLKVKSLDPITLDLGSKTYVAQTIPQFSPQSLTLNLKKIDLPALKDFTSKHLNFILKPARAAGGFGAMSFTSGTADDVIQHCQKFSHTDWIISEFLRGDLISMEGFVHQGLCFYLGFSTRTKIKGTETSSTFSAKHTLPSDILMTTQNAIATLVQRSNVKNSYFHTEFIITERAAYLIDANFGRIGGGAIAESVAKVYQIDPTDVFKHIIALSLSPSQLKSPYERATSRLSTSINYGIPQAATIKSVIANHSDKTRHTLLLGSGNTAPALGENNWSWIGLLSGWHEDVLEEIKHIKIITDQGEFFATY